MGIKTKEVKVEVNPNNRYPANVDYKFTIEGGKIEEYKNSNPQRFLAINGFNDKTVTAVVETTDDVIILLKVDNREFYLNNEAEAMFKRFSTQERALGLHIANCSNFDLLIDKYPRYNREDKAFYLLSDKNKKVLFDSTSSYTKDPELIKFINTAKAEAIKNLYGVGNFISLSLKTTADVQCGLGGSSVHENDITLHSTLGYPIIPGEGWRGVVRNAIIVECFNAHEDEAIKNEFFSLLFGKEKQKNVDDETSTPQLEESAGVLHFQDALPQDDFALQVEVTTGHNSSYFEFDERKENAFKYPKGNDAPIPVQNLSTTGTFNFYLGIDECNGAKQLKEFPCWNKLIPVAGDTKGDKALEQLKETDTLEEFLTRWIKKALADFGVGAKTRLGYGKLE